MRNIRLLAFVSTISLIHTLSAAICTPTTTKTTQAEWTILAYIQADNNLSPFALYNINDMQIAPLSSAVNMLVQWDQPNNNRTWRYRITHGGRIEDASLSTEMGINPEQELVDMVRWGKTKYDAKHWAIILWNHGYGIIDPRHKAIDKFLKFNLRAPTHQSIPWLEIPGLAIQKESGMRGILFDDSQSTYATNQNLTNAFARIKTDIIGKNIDIIGMDACLMAMLEIGYQIKNSADILVASQQTEPGEGWSYSGFLNPLCLNPTKFTSTMLAATIVYAYANFYKGQTRDYTQSAIKLNAIDTIKDNIKSLISATAACEKINRQTTRQIISSARRAAISFDVSDYIDLHSFYSALVKQLKKYRSSKKGKPVKANTRFARAATQLLNVINAGMPKITAAVIANETGSQFANAKGISIYYPTGNIHASYLNTIFDKQTNWSTFIKKYR